MTRPAHPLVSVVMPCYRQGRFLTQSIGSLLAQSYPNIEIIVVDDGSDDETEQVAKIFIGRVKYLRRPNGGPAAARNTGIRSAQGDYILFMDADDAMHPSGIEWLVRAAQERTDVLCAMGVRWFESDDNLVTGHEVYPPLDSLEAELLLNNFNPPLGFLCSRKSIVAVGGFDPSPRINACEDWEMWTRLLFAGIKIVAVQSIGAYYRQHPTSLSRNQLRMSRSRIEVMSRNLRWAKSSHNRLRSFGLDPSAFIMKLRTLIGREYFHAAYHLRERGSYIRSARHYIFGLLSTGRLVEAITGICKLLPHSIMHITSRASKI